MLTIICTLALSAEVLLQAQPSTEAQAVQPVDQAVQGIGQEPADTFTMKWSIQAGYAWQFRSNVTNGGRVSWNRAHADVRGRMPLSDDLELLVGARYQYEQFDFDGAGLSGSPFGAVDTVQIDGALQWKMSPHWQLFGGGQIIFSGQDGADFGDSVIGGGAIGAVYSFHDRLSLGGGVGVRSQILDDVLIYPIVVVEWAITDELRLSTRLTSGWANQTGAELIYELKEGVDVGVAAVFDYQRFRLSDDNPDAPGGAGTSEMLPVAFFISFDVADNISVTAFVGANVHGRVKVTDVNRNDVWASNYDAAPILGLQGTISF
jgi:hypothetical protein